VYAQTRIGQGANVMSFTQTPGLVDSGYRGELLVNLVNHDEGQPFIAELCRESSS
jgi:dUTPase